MTGRALQVSASTLGQFDPRHELPSRPYRWRGTPGWNPAAGLPGRPERAAPHNPGGRNRTSGATPAQLARAAERRAEFKRLREEEGLAIIRCAARMRIGSSTAQGYEKARKAAL